MRTQRLTIGLADLRGFTNLIQAVGWERGVAALDETYARLGDLIGASGGRIVKYLGDAVLFVFDQPAAAVAAADAIARERWTIAGQAVRYCVGVATGDVVVTEIGHASRRVDDVYGDPVVRVFQLLAEARTQPDGLALDAATRATLKSAA